MGLDIASLELRLNYKFQNHELAVQALTHRSAAKLHNERLEYLGDSVLGFVIADTLYQKMPQQSEGELSRMRANLVNKDSLEEIARSLELGSLVQLGAGERQSGGKKRASILADAVEALIGAMYLDGGLEPCRQFILQQSKERLKDVSSTPELKDSKTELQEILQSRALALPKYEAVSVDGKAHDQTFTVKCHVALLTDGKLGTGKNKRSAQQAAAKAVLDELNSGSTSASSSQHGHQS